MQWPSLQASPAGQTLPQPLQFLGSVRKFVQLLKQHCGAAWLSWAKKDTNRRAKLKGRRNMTRNFFIAIP
jgi:hypothetical protein